MKTYTKTITATHPRLEILHEDSPESPRKWDNLGYFITISNKVVSPDDDNGEIYNIVKNTSDEVSNQEEHMKLIKRDIKNVTGEKVLAIYPVCRHEHSSVSYSLGNTKGFHYSNNSFYIVTDKTAKLIGTPKSKFERVIAQELKTYTAYVNGEVYGFKLYDEDGELVDTCWGFYDIDDIKGALPDEWATEQMRDYLID